MKAVVCTFSSDKQVPDFASCSDITFYTDPFTHTAIIDCSHISAKDNDDFAPTIICDPPEGTALSPGYYPVTCVATDLAGNERICHSHIEVRGKIKVIPLNILLDLTEYIDGAIYPCLCI